MTDSDRGEIVVGVDAGVSAVAAVRWAAARSARSGSHLRVVHVLDPVAAGAVGPDADPILRAALADARARATGRVLEALADSEAVAWSLDVEQGDPATVLVSASRDAAMLVIGAAEPPGAGEPHGSVGRHCRGHSGVPVVTVPASTVKSTDREWVRTPEGDILAP